MEIKTIKELHEKCRSGEIDESRLRIILDNDNTGFEIVPDEGVTDENYEQCRIEVEEASGYCDIEKLYPLLFPKAKVEWC